jgi:hypothetical protein
VKPRKETVIQFERLSDDGTRLIGGASVLRPCELSVTAPDRRPVLDEHGVSASWVQSMTVMLTRHATSIRVRPCHYLCDSAAHRSLTATRLAALGNHFLPETRFDRQEDSTDIDAGPAPPPPLVGARTSTAPPHLDALCAQLEALTV